MDRDDTSGNAVRFGSADLIGKKRGPAELLKQ